MFLWPHIWCGSGVRTLLTQLVPLTPLTLLTPLTTPLTLLMPLRPLTPLRPCPSCRCRRASCRSRRRRRRWTRRRATWWAFWAVLLAIVYRRWRKRRIPQLVMSPNTLLRPFLAKCPSLRAYAATPYLITGFVQTLAPDLFLRKLKGVLNKLYTDPAPFSKFLFDEEREVFVGTRALLVPKSIKRPLPITL